MARRTPTTRTRRTQGQNTSSTKTYRSRTSSTTCSRTSRTRSRNNTASNQVAINPCQGRPVLSCAHRTSVLRVSVNSGSKTNTRTTRRRCGISKSDVRMMMMIQIGEFLDCRIRGIAFGNFRISELPNSGIWLRNHTKNQHKSENRIFRIYVSAGVWCPSLAFLSCP